MNAADAISAADLDGGDSEPCYFCEQCGRQISYPAEHGKCDRCEFGDDDDNEPGHGTLG